MHRSHTPVLSSEAIKYLNVRKNKKYIDATIGEGGHTAAILKSGGLVLGIDCDPEAIEFTENQLAANFKSQSASWRTNFKLIQGNFREIDKIAREHGFDQVAGVLFDLGMSSWQIEHSGRGFSFQKDELLDMRMDPRLKITARDLVNGLTRKELNELLTKFGEEKFSHLIANAIVRTRRIKPIRTTLQLKRIIQNVYSTFIRKHSGRLGSRKIHPATRTFQALRIAVNSELENLKKALPQSIPLLEKGGRIVVISFHSLEDRIVKYELTRIKNESSRIRILTKKPIRPSEKEIKENPKARSAKLRAAEKIKAPCTKLKATA